MRRILFLILCLFIFFGSAYAQRMSDEQVVEYVKQAQAAGKSQKQMTAELLRRGVTREQVLRIKDKYENSGVAVSGSEAPSQMRKRSVAVGESYEAAELDDQKAVVDERLESQSAPEAAGIHIFCHNLFHNRNLSFEPSVNLATPANYRLGPGDEVIIDIWGASENTIRQTISPEGSIQVKDLGPVYLNGMTVKEANAYLQRELSKIYSGIGGGDPNSQIRLTLGDIRTIQIHIMGEVTVPGTYTLSAFSTVFHALYRAGGVNNIGSLRDIRLVRNGETIEHLDVYEFIMQGKMNDDVRLQEGDVIIVSPYQSLVEIVGKVKRPMYYEMKPAETVAPAAPVAEEKIDFSNVEIEPLFADFVDFDTFSKSDFRAVKIKACEAVKKSTKLLKFILDDGTGTDRVILSGIHEYYEPEELVGKTCIAITNLPPRPMMGIDSCGMLISAVHHENGQEKLHLLMVDPHIPAGAKLY